mgnify:CR=1 FL=1
METRETIFSYLNNHKTAVVATLSATYDKQPTAATIVPKFREDFSCIFSTSILSRKYLNLKTNSKVAIVVGFEHDDPFTMQYEGIASGIEEDHQRYFKLVQELEDFRPELGKYLHLPQTAMVVVKPVWVRFSKTDVYPAQTTELIF